MVGESVAVATDFLGEHVHVLDTAVRRTAGVVVGEDLVAPPIDRSGEPGQLGNLDFGAVVGELQQSAACVSFATGRVYGSQELLSVNRPSGGVGPGIRE